MAFERAKIVIKQASTGTGVKVSLAKVRGAQAKMKLSVNDALARTFGWADGDKLEVLLGTDEHHGIIRMRKNNSVGDAVVTYRKALHGGYVSIALGHQEMFIDRVEPAKWCQFERIDDGYVEIILPTWADETSPRKKPKPTMAPQVNVTAPSSGKVVTPTLMGDPPPGRREMLDKIASVKL